MKTSRLLKIASLLGCGLCLLPLNAFQRSVSLSGADSWQDLIHYEGLRQETGKWGAKDLVLEDLHTQLTPQSDLLLNFDAQPLLDASGHYTVHPPAPLISTTIRRYGRGSGGFRGSRDTLKLAPGPASFFAPGQLGGDFTVEFWLHPTTLAQGESVLDWHSSYLAGEELRQQRLSCHIMERRLRWNFDNFFFIPGGAETHFQLQALDTMLPGRWYHHLLRFDSSTGLLEYLIDGVPQALLYTTTDGREGSSVALPYIGPQAPGMLYLGKDFNGFLDEFHLQRGFVEQPRLFTYSDTPGSGTSRIFDLEYNGSHVQKIDAVYTTPGNSAVYFYYKIADQLLDWETLPSAWTPILPGQALPASASGQYFQIRLELYADGTRSLSPSVSRLTFTYEPDLPPAPPSALRVTPGDGQVTLNWNKVNATDLGGYLIFYGNSPGVYHESAPLDAGLVQQFTINGLQNGRLYYFTVVAYDNSTPPHRSLFAREVSARPSVLAP